MKIVSWNCNGALRKKLGLLEAFDADLFVIQECENPASSTHHYQQWAGDYLWCGTSKNKGIGVFPKKGNHVARLGWAGNFKMSGMNSNSSAITWSTSDLNLFLPFSINNQYTALGVWTKGSENEVFGYMGQFWKYLQIHRADLSSTKTLVLGDFNSNRIWDKPDRWWNHSDVISELEEIGLTSLYHLKFSEDQGAESWPTFFLHKNKEKPYHIDYVFLSGDMISGSQMDIGQYENWITASDHMPMEVNIP